MGSFLGNLFVAFDDSAIRRSIALLGVRPNHRVLAIGYTPGLLDALAKAASEGLVEAVDEPKIIEKARKKYAAAIDDGHLNVAEGDERQLPFANGFFDRVVAVERFERWMDPVAGLAEARRVMRQDGLIVIALRKLEKGTIKREAAKLNDIVKAGNRDEAMLAALRESGFIKCAIEQDRFAVAVKPLDFTTDAPRT